jgi:hypothetical protein
MALIGCDGIEQPNSGEGLHLLSPKSIFAKLGDNAGVEALQVLNSDDEECMEVKSNKDVRIFGNLFTEGEHFVINSEEVNIGDSVITLNAEITASSAHDPGGIALKRVTADAALNASGFASATNTITIAGGPGGLAAGDLFYVYGSEKNDGTYKVGTVNATSIVINTSPTEYGFRSSLEDETIAAKINEAIPELMIWDDGWRIIRYEAGANKLDFLVLGYHEVADKDFSGIEPDMGARGDSGGDGRLGSGAIRVGLFGSALAKYNNPSTLQDFAEQTADRLNNNDGPYEKSGQASIANAADSVAITFGTAFSSNCDTVLFSLQNTVDATPKHYTLQLTTVAATGFTVTLSEDTDSANYKLNWIAKGS